MMGPMQTTEPATMEATIDRYVIMFNEADDATRADLGREVFADDVRLVDRRVGAPRLISLVVRASRCSRSAQWIGLQSPCLP